MALRMSAMSARNVNSANIILNAGSLVIVMHLSLFTITSSFQTPASLHSPYASGYHKSSLFTHLPFMPAHFCTSVTSVSPSFSSAPAPVSPSGVSLAMTFSKWLHSDSTGANSLPTCVTSSSERLSLLMFWRTSSRDCKGVRIRPGWIMYTNDQVRVLQVEGVPRGQDWRGWS
jgi:hypothetical protein